LIGDLGLEPAFEECCHAGLHVDEAGRVGVWVWAASFVLVLAVLVEERVDFLFVFFGYVEWEGSES